MPQGAPPEAFGREMGCTEAEWLQWLPAAVGGRGIDRVAPGHAQVALEAGGRLRLQWRALAPRTIALLAIPRLQVEFAFDGVAPAARADFMRHFDLYTRRGGG